ncbi:peptidylprolyl isomerase [Limnohabitans sp. Rim8]|uniref:Periplasmic chaperone PpiD n=1 Tax=Limnohabitans curvus TaxID=323423 RepID=A0A315ETN2_9BURK|nr:MULTISPECIES: SurA N-terminal domain-containing protein [Limnohabitans]PUE57548.1 peptidylprolyl isomerase [Limnohabitans sp. Rim8]PUE60198.1 peptidylprolyl isomerase [Limnohabitans curvus]
MFDFVRKHTRVMQFLLFLLIFPSFVLFGLEGYNRFREGGATVATVDGHDITQADWDAAHRSQVERMRSSMPNVDVKLFDTPEAKYSTLERMVRDRLLQVAASKLRLGASDARLAAELQQNPTIAALRRADGTLDMERYRQLLATQGMSPESFEAQVRGDLASRQVMSGVGVTSFSANALADVTLNAFYEQRQVQVAKFVPADFVSQIKPSDEDLETYYKANADKFQSAERADIEYVVLDLAAVQKGIVVPEAELKSYYEQNAARLAGLEERRASHILINADKGASAAERDAARVKAQSLLAEVQKSPNQFAELARKNSQDTGSAAKGGDLDFFGRGAMVKPFEEAAFALKKGETSGVVETEFGFHIIRLTDIKLPEQKSFESQRAKLEQEVRGQLAQRKFAEAAEQFTNIVYEQSDSLKPVAERLKLDVQHASNLGREVVAGMTAANNPKLLAAVFSPDSIEKKRNTEAVELAPNVLAAARITSYSPARTLPLDEVKARVREQVVAQLAGERARSEGAAKLTEWKASPDAAKLPAAIVVSRESKQAQPSALVEAALRASTQTLPAWVGVDLGVSGYAVVKVEKVLPRDAANSQSLAREREQYAQWWASAEGLAYYKLLKEKFKAEIKVARL